MIKIIFFILTLTLSAQSIIVVVKKPIVTSTSNSGDVYVKDATEVDSIGVTVANRIATITSVTFSSNLTLYGTIDSSLAPGDTSWIKYTATTSVTGNFSSGSITVTSTANNSPTTGNISYDVVPSSNILLAPTTLVATNNEVTGIGLTWTDPNTTDTVFVETYDWSVSTDLDAWTSYHSEATEGSIVSGKLRVLDDNFTTSHPSMYRKYEVENSRYYRIKVDAYVGTATSVWLYIIDNESPPTTYANYNSATDTSYTVLIPNPSEDSIFVYLQGLTADGEYVEFDNFTLERTEASYDSFIVERQLFFNETPDFDFAELVTVNSDATTYSDLSVIEDNEYNYRIRYKDGTEYSNYSNEASDTFYIPISPPTYTPDYFVSSSSGADANDGLTESTAWASVSKVNSASFSSGDVVAFKRSDLFTDNLTATQGVTYTAYGTGNKPQITASSGYVISATSIDSVIIDNLSLIGIGWLELATSDYWTVNAVDMKHYDSSDVAYCADKPVYLNHSDNNTFTYNTFKGCPAVEYQDLFYVWGSSQYNLIEYNQFLNASHVLLYFKGAAPSSALISYTGDTYPHHNIVRHNYFYSVYHAGLLNIGGAYENLIEYNYFERNGMGVDGVSSIEPGFEAKYGGSTRGIALYAHGYHHIIRKNIFRKGGAPESEVGTSVFDGLSRVNADDVPDRVEYHRIYSNTFYDNWGRPMKIGVYNNEPGDEAYLGSDGSKLWNNLFYKSGEDSTDFISYAGYAPGSFSPTGVSVEMDYNGFMTSTTQDNITISGGATPHFRYDDLPATYGDASITIDGLNNNVGNDGTFSYSPTITTELFSTDWSTISTMYMPEETSQLVDAGGFVTTVNGVVTSSVTVPVDDATWFVDPTDFDSMIVGDSLYFSNGSKGLIASISGNTITLVSAVTLADGEGVSLPYTGLTPDIGAVEYGSEDTEVVLPVITNLALTPSQAVEEILVTTTFTNNSPTINAYSSIATVLDDLSFNPLTMEEMSISGNTATYTYTGLAEQEYYIGTVVVNGLGSSGDVTDSTTIVLGSETSDTIYIATGLDDSFTSWGSSYSGTNDYLYIGDDGSTSYEAGFRFMGITEVGTLVSATLQVSARNSLSGNVNVRAYGQDIDSALAFVARTDFDARTRTTAYVDTAITESWTADSFYSFDVTSIISEIFGSYTIADDAVVIFLDDNSSATHRLIKAYEHTDAEYPRLIITYSN